MGSCAARRRSPPASRSRPSSSRSVSAFLPVKCSGQDSGWNVTERCICLKPVARMVIYIDRWELGSVRRLVWYLLLCSLTGLALLGRHSLPTRGIPVAQVTPCLFEASKLFPGVSRQRQCSNSCLFFS
jgi:hypothetical protein